MLAFSPSTSDEEKRKIRILYDELEKVCEDIQNIISPFLKKNFNVEDFSPFEYERIFRAALLIQTEINERLLPQYRADPERILFNYGSKTIIGELDDLLLRMQSTLINDPRNAKGAQAISYLEFFSHELSNIYVNFAQGYSEHVRNQEFISSLEKQLNEAKSAVKNIESAKRALEGQKTEEIYSEASENFLTAARNYEVIFYMLIGAALIITVICLAYFPYSEATKINFIFSKILTAMLVITLGTLFLRKAAHLRKLHEQANQTSLELQALPLFLRNIDESEHTEIYKNLVEKYFGKELDQTQNDKIGDLMKDQITAGTELIKASAELVKNAKTISTSVDKTKITKPNNTSVEDKTKSEGDG